MAGAKPYSDAHVVLGGRAHPLRLTFRAYREIRAQTGLDLFAADVPERFDTLHLAVMVAEMSNFRDCPLPPITLEDAEQWITAANLAQVHVAVFAAALLDVRDPDAQAEPGEGSAPDPLPPGRRRRRWTWWPFGRRGGSLSA